ncbi:MAG: hypothetical protein AAGI71_15900 [Bacteroidota bacterium]
MSLAVFLRRVVLLMMAFGPPCVGQAQPTNRVAYETLAAACLTPAVDTLETVRLDPMSTPPFLYPSLVQGWIEQGVRVYGGAEGLAVPVLLFTAEQAVVDYHRAGRRRIGRTVSLALRYQLSTPDAQILASGRCADIYQDEVPRDALEALADPALPLTQAAPPPPPWIRRVLEPAVLVVATGVVTYLFFSLRSDRDEDNGG